MNSVLVQKNKWNETNKSNIFEDKRYANKYTLLK